ncbi:MAG: autotransporter-associated beta strand repeat-containing protein [Planctomycetia bacterium]|nr:autotransporter-associated beta strand repeat-containing protein [Planctomycetia bacterium]
MNDNVIINSGTVTGFGNFAHLTINAGGTLDNASSNNTSFSTKLTVNGGTFNAGTFYSVPTETGSTLEMKSGNITTTYFTLSQGSNTAGLSSTFDMYGGNLNITAGNLRIGYQNKAIMNVYGGNIMNAGGFFIDQSGKGSVLNIYGGNSTWELNSLNCTHSTGFLNYIADGKTGISTLKVSGNTVNLSSTVTVDMADFYDAGVAYTSEKSFALLKATGSGYGWSSNSSVVNGNGEWEIVSDKTAKTASVNFVLDDSAMANADFLATGSGIATGTDSATLGASGWVKLTGNANDTVTLKMYYGEEYASQGDALAAWLTENSGLSATNNPDGFIEFSGLTLNSDGNGYFSYNIGDYGDGSWAFQNYVMNKINLKGVDLTIDTLDPAMEKYYNTGEMATLTVGKDGLADTEYAGLITGPINLVKVGDNKLTLTGTNDYSGTTTIQEGTLALRGTCTLNDLSIHNGGKLTAETLILNGSVTLDASAQDSDVLGTIFADTLTLGDNFELELVGDVQDIPTEGFAVLIGNEIATTSGASEVNWSDYLADSEKWILTLNTSFNYEGVMRQALMVTAYDPNAVPEPSTWILLVLCVAGGLAIRKRSVKA